jgi:dTDP-4-dehydrorhamnose reductase
VEGVKNLIAFAKIKKLKLVHFSSDFVFDGIKESSYQETSAPNPINVYGQSKLEGEALLQKAKCLNTIFRISWLFSPFGKNFVKTIINTSQEKKEINVVNDQWGKPTYGIDLARAVLNLLEHPNLFKYKIYNFAQGPKTNWHEFASNIVALSGADCLLKPVDTSAYSLTAKRPFNVILDTQKIEKTFSLSIRGWEEALIDCVKKIRENEVI